MSRRTVAAAMLLSGLLAACGGGGSKDGASADGAGQVRTIEQEHLSVDRDLAVADEDAASAAKPDAVALPFEPAISMDPVDGSKVSIRSTTPSLEFKGRIYHFSSEANLKLFEADPAKYLSGSLASY